MESFIEIVISLRFICFHEQYSAIKLHFPQNENDQIFHKEESTQIFKFFHSFKISVIAIKFNPYKPGVPFLGPRQTV